jgi:hypothetical protein
LCAASFLSQFFKSLVLCLTIASWSLDRSNIESSRVVVKNDRLLKKKLVELQALNCKSRRIKKSVLRVIVLMNENVAIYRKG